MASLKDVVGTDVCVFPPAFFFNPGLATDSSLAKNLFQAPSIQIAEKSLVLVDVPAISVGFHAICMTSGILRRNEVGDYVATRGAHPKYFFKCATRMTKMTEVPGAEDPSEFSVWNWK
jgi:hypothetical protein